MLSAFGTHLKCLEHLWNAWKTFRVHLNTWNVSWPTGSTWKSWVVLSVFGIWMTLHVHENDSKSSVVFIRNKPFAFFMTEILCIIFVFCTYEVNVCIWMFICLYFNHELIVRVHCINDPSGLDYWFWHSTWVWLLIFLSVVCSKEKVSFKAFPLDISRISYLTWIEFEKENLQEKKTWTLKFPSDSTNAPGFEHCRNLLLCILKNYQWNHL